jgi:uroporphyrinogen decarboxylase
MMNHRLAVRAVLAGEPPVYPLADLGGRVASLSTPAYLDLKSFLGLGSDLTCESLTLLNTISHFDERVLEAFDIPFRRLYLRPPSTFRLQVDDSGAFHDEWGVGYKAIGPYNERIGHPLAGATLDDLENYPWPDPNDPGRLEDLAEEAQKLYKGTDYCLVAGHISAGVFQDCWNLRGMQQFMIDLVADPEFASSLLERVTAVHAGMWTQFLGVVGPYIDIVETADDLGGQNGPLISPGTYRQMIKPHHAALFSAIRQRCQARILYHSCGAILPLIDDLIEIGVDILNPIQPLPGRMDPETLRQRFGDRLIFHGGLDVQNLLLKGTPDQVRMHVRRYLEILRAERYIMAPANSVQPGTPPENLIAAYEAAREFSESMV